MDENEVIAVAFNTVSDSVVTVPEMEALAQVAAAPIEEPVEPVYVSFDPADVVLEAYDNETDGHCTVTITMNDGRKFSASTPRTDSLATDQATAKTLATA